MRNKVSGCHAALCAAALVFLISLFFLGQALLTQSLNYAFDFVGYGGTFQYSHISILGFKLSLYWLFMAVGAVSMVLFCLFRRNRVHLGAVPAAVTGVLLSVLGYIGAKLLYIAENWKHVQEAGISSGGVSFFGTVFLMPIVLPLLALLLRQKPTAYLDYCTPAGVIMLACIRIGCFMNGCCRGISFWFLNRPVTLPVQLWECALDFLLLAGLLHLEQKHKWDGSRYFIFMGGYGLLRFVLEFVRDTPKTHLGLSNGQWFAILCMIILLLVYTIDTRRRRRTCGNRRNHAVPDDKTANFPL